MDTNNKEILNTLRQIQDTLEGPDSMFATIGDYYDVVASERYSRDEDFRRLVDAKLERSEHLWGRYVSPGNDGRAHGQAVRVASDGNVESIEYGTTPQLSTPTVERITDGDDEANVEQLNSVMRVSVRF